MARLVLGTNINNTGTSSTVVEKLVPMPTSNCIQKDLDDGKIINSDTIINLEGAHDVGDFALCKSYYLNPYISGNIDLSELTAISGRSACEDMFAAQEQYDWMSFGEPYSIDSQITSVDLSGLTSITGQNACKRMFYECKNLESVDFSSLALISGNNACSDMFLGCAGITGALDLSSLTHIEDDSNCMEMFYDCTGITSVDLSGLETIGNIEVTSYEGGQNFEYMFAGCTNLVSVDMSGLTHVLNGQQNFMYMFSNCTNLTTVNLSNLVSLRGMQHFYCFISDTSVEVLSFDSLNDLGESIGLAGAGMNAKKLKHFYLPALTSNSFHGKTDHFSSLVKNVTGCTVHFPSNLQSIIGSWSSVQSGFGGTNTTVLYDLPATE